MPKITRRQLQKYLKDEARAHRRAVAIADGKARANVRSNTGGNVRSNTGGNVRSNTGGNVRADAEARVKAEADPGVEREFHAMIGMKVGFSCSENDLPFLTVPEIDTFTDKFERYIQTLGHTKRQSFVTEMFGLVVSDIETQSDRDIEDTKFDAKIKYGSSDSSDSTKDMELVLKGFAAIGKKNSYTSDDLYGLDLIKDYLRKVMVHSGYESDFL